MNQDAPNTEPAPVATPAAGRDPIASCVTYDRRAFLRSTAGGTAAIAFASLLPAGCARDYPQAGADGVMLRALSAKEYATVRAAAQALLTDVPVTPAHVAAAIDAELAIAGEPTATDIKTVLSLVEHLTFLAGHVRRFSALPAPDRLDVLDSWAHSRFKLRRGAYQALQGFVRYFAFIDDATRPLTGFQGPWPERFDLPYDHVDFGEVQ